MFLQDLLDSTKAFSTIKVYLASCDEGFGNAPNPRCSFICVHSPCNSPLTMGRWCYALLSCLRLTAYTGAPSLLPPAFLPKRVIGGNLLCPIRALSIYLDNQLFVSWASSHRGKPPCHQRLSNWVVEAGWIILAYKSLWGSLHAHTRCMATSRVLSRGISVNDICATVSMASTHTFIRLYHLDLTVPLLAHQLPWLVTAEVPQWDTSVVREPELLW